MPTTTPTFALPVPVTGDNNDVPTNMLALANAVETMLKTVCPAGTVRTTLNTVADAGWLLHNQTVANAQTLYTALWAVAPAAWKSGSSLVIPNLTDTALMGYGGLAAIGAVVGANTVQLVEANLPSHAHSMSAHTHDMGSHTHSVSITSQPNSVDHTHSMQNHAHSGTTAFGGAHNHGNPPWGANGFMYNDVGTSGSSVGTGGGLRLATWSSAPDHQHSFSTGGPSSADTGGVSVNHTHAVNGGTQGPSTNTTTGPSVAGTGNGNGTATTFSIVQRSLGVQVQIRAY